MALLPPVPTAPSHGSGTMTINDEIVARMHELSPAERKVARALLAQYPTAGLESAKTLAQAAGTSTPTVLRLVARLGIGSYPDLQRRLREEVTHHMNSPVRRTEERTAVPEPVDPLRRAVARAAELTSALVSTVPPGEFDRAVAALAAHPREVAISGGYFSRYVAMLLATQLEQVIPNVDFVAEPLGHDIGKTLRLGRKGVAVIFDFRRHELAARQAAEAAKRQGATVIVVTDPSLSPAAESADVVLPVPVDGIPFDSLAAPVALVEALVEAVLRQTGERGLQRMQRFEESVRIARAYRPEPDLVEEEAV